MRTSAEAQKDLLKSVDVALNAQGFDELVEYLEHETYGGEISTMSEGEQAIMIDFIDFLMCKDIDRMREDASRKKFDEIMQIVKDTRKRLDEITKEMEGFTK